MFFNKYIVGDEYMSMTSAWKLRYKDDIGLLPYESLASLVVPELSKPQHKHGFGAH